LSKGLSLAFLDGGWNRRELNSRGGEALGGRPAWLGPLVRRVLATFEAAPLGREDELIAFLAEDPELRQAASRPDPPRIRRWFLLETKMVPVTPAFPVFPLPAHDVLARELAVRQTELAWLADVQGINAKTSREPLLNYRYRWIAKRRGGHRLLEAPKYQLKGIQRWVLANILSRVPTSPAAHGFVRGKSVRSFVEPHTGKEVVVRLDLEAFFGSIGRARVVRIFRRLGYPGSLARTLAGLCTAATPRHVLAAHPPDERRFDDNQRLRQPHLPQGAPTSPALSNLAAWRLDRRLAGLAASYGATMTRYADDLAFAGDRAFRRALPFFLPQVGAIALEEGFRINHRKTRVMPRSRRQQLCGLVVNQKPNLPRQELDNLRALLCNAARFGPQSQNRAGHPRFHEHLEGRIAHVASIHPARGQRLRALFERIRWDAEPGR
jgi:RNA-directed DNA polymerase